MEQSVYNQTQIFNIERKYSKIDVNDEFCLFKVIISTEKTKIKSKPYNRSVKPSEPVEEIYQGVCTNKEFKTALNKGEVPPSSRVTILSDKQLEIFAQFGFHAFHDASRFFNGSAYIVGNGEFKEIPVDDFLFDDYTEDDRISLKELDQLDLFDIVSDHPNLINNLFIMDYPNHHIYDLNHVAQPLVFKFDYMSGNMTNKKYDLDKVLEWAKKRGNVIVNKASRYGKSLDLIGSVPHYNNESGRTTQLEIWIQPTKEEYNKMLDYQKSQVAYVDNYFSIWNTDALDLNQCAIDPKGSYYTELDDDDDDIDDF